MPRRVSGLLIDALCWHAVQDIQLWMRRRGYRVNLRWLAEVQTLIWIGVAVLVLWLFCLFCSWVSGLASDTESGHHSIGQLEVQGRYASSQPSTRHFDPQRPSTYSSHIHDAHVDL